MQGLLAAAVVVAAGCSYDSPGAWDMGGAAAPDTGGEDQTVEDRLWYVTQEVWIGLHDPHQDGAYFWTDGTPPMAFHHWSGGSAPPATSPDCVAKNTSVFDGAWRARSCADQRPAVCECEP